MNEFIILFGWLGKVLFVAAIIIAGTVAFMAIAGNLMKRSREKREKSQSVLTKSGRGDIRIQK